MPGKDEIRAEMRRRRRALTDAERRAAAARICRTLSARALAAPIAVYLASPAEPDLGDFINEARARGLPLVAPRWNGCAYELAPLGDGLRTGPMGIREPAAGEAVPPSRVATWLVPGLGFTRKGGRLGYGGGWYDRLLAEADPSAARLGIGFACQVVAELPCEPHDIPLTGLVTG